ncbi:MAG TPA: 50S ribosomal protein L11 methyltransferase [Reyranella sp.]
MSVAKASFVVPAAERAAWEDALEERLGDAGVVVTSCEISRDGPWRIEIFGEAEERRVAEAIADGARSLGLPARPWKWETLPDTDWVAENQRSFKPFTVGPFWVHPSHVAEKEQPADTIALRIDAGLAFGTGTHATTRGCLELLATLGPQDVVVAVDVGCGSGILGIAMAKLWYCPVLCTDNDEDAIRVARENAVLNEVDPLCHFFHANGLESAEIAAIGPFELIVANILAGPLLGLVDSFAAAVRPRGRVLLSGLLVEQADEIVAAYGHKGFAPEHHIDLETGGAWWRTLLLRRN